MLSDKHFEVIAIQYLSLEVELDYALFARSHQKYPPRLII